MRGRKDIPGFIVGLVIMIFALLGVLSLISLGVSAVKHGKEEKLRKQYAEYNEFLIPAAAIDIRPFDDITHASMSELVEMSVMSILDSELKPDAYEYADGKLAIPAAEVEAAFTGFFGTDVKISHMTVEGYGYEFTYDATNGVYYIPLTTITPIYTPQVSGIEKKGTSLIVTCGLANASLWTQDKLTGELKAPEPDKYIKVTMRSIGRQMFISAIQSSGTPETAATLAQPETNATSTVPATEETAQSSVPEETADTSAEASP